jgi:hypothetical protein
MFITLNGCFKFQVPSTVVTFWSMIPTTIISICLLSYHSLLYILILDYRIHSIILSQWYPSPAVEHQTAQTNNNDTPTPAKHTS